MSRGLETLSVAFIVLSYPGRLNTSTTLGGRALSLCPTTIA
jgi:hypothetical protein